MFIKRAKPLVIPFLFFVMYLVFANIMFSVLHIGAIQATVISNLFLSGLCIVYVLSPYGKMAKNFASTRSHLLFKNLPEVAVLFIYFGIYFLIYVYTQLSVRHILHIFGDASFEVYKELASNELAYMAILTAFVAPISEELFFRGVVYSSLRRSIPVFGAAILQAIMFAMMHGTRVHLWLCILSGFFMSVLYERFGKISYCIVFHSVFNLMTFFIHPANLPAIFTNLPVVFLVNVLLFGVVLVFFFDTQSNMVFTINREEINYGEEKIKEKKDA